MIYAQYLVLNTKNEVSDLLGSDGVLRLDGRHTINRQVATTRQRMKALKKSVQPHIIGFKIISSSRLYDEGQTCYIYYIPEITNKLK